MTDPWRVLTDHQAAVARQFLAARDADVAASILPPEPPADAIAAIDAWLRDVRQRFW
ncbi:MAG TPA: hypothetical protein VFP84_38680 [Kofleriaceae bacterium]|nr:hypothetical protein [Kofleriaceae bacterium]